MAWKQIIRVAALHGKKNKIAIEINFSKNSF
jgi:hypothetical protein